MFVVAIDDKPEIAMHYVKKQFKIILTEAFDAKPPQKE